MLKLFFEFMYFLTYFIPSKQLRSWVRVQKLFDYKAKLNALKSKYPEIKKIKLIKGGWNIGFIVDNKYVFKIRKSFYYETDTKKVLREKRLTDTFGGMLPLQIPHINIIKIDNYTFFMYNFIPGKNLNKCSWRTICKNKHRWAHQIAEFIYILHNSNPVGLDEYKTQIGDGWNHNDLCNNMIINPKTFDIVAAIDWEYAKWGKLETEFNNCVKFSSKLRKSGILDLIKQEYTKLDS